ncbi:complement factor H-like isoform 3-T3 [Discoglossus pictus]
MSLLGYLIVFTALHYTVQSAATCTKPDRMQEAELQGDWEEATYPEGTKAAFICRPGYSRRGSIRMICSEGKWEFISPRGQCQKKACGHPGDIDFGTFELTEGTEFVFGAIVEYKCDDGYQMVSKQKTRECTANGWSHFPPHCEVRRCAPVRVGEDVNLISTSFDDEEFSVGQVVQFECKNPKHAIDGPKEIFCKSEGEWSADPPTCKKISCSEPQISNGKVKIPRKTYNEDERISYECNAGYKPDRSPEATCTKNGWSPPPSCLDIVCYPDNVENGKIFKIKNVYREGEIVALECDRGYQIEHLPEEPRKCTKNGWYPPLKCISKLCDRPDIKNGYVYTSYFSGFPRKINSVLDYYCYDGFLSPNKYRQDKTKCTDNGWEPTPQCLKYCYYSGIKVENAEFYRLQSYYLSGEQVRFTCKVGFSTEDGNNSGHIECLPNGSFSRARCRRVCNMPSLNHGSYVPKKPIFETGEYVQYECFEGYTSPQRNKKDSAECLQSGWSITPKCVEIKCPILANSKLISPKAEYRDGEVAEVSCPAGYRLSSLELSQCYYYGWDPVLPTCEEIRCHIPSNRNFRAQENKNVFGVNELVEISCNDGFTPTVKRSYRCVEQGWDPELPVCKDEPAVSTASPIKPETTAAPTTPKVDGNKPESKTQCPLPPNPRNAQQLDLKSSYHNGDSVEIKCKAGYNLYGSKLIRCQNGKWESSPQCIESQKCESPPVIENGKIAKDSTQEEYFTDSVVRYTCNAGFQILSESDESFCFKGKWTRPPVCTGIPCGKAEIIPFAVIPGEKTSYSHGDSVIYQCISGYKMTSDIKSTCISGEWHNPPTCIPSFCGSPPSISNGRITSQKQDTYNSGEKATYQCNTGHAFERSRNQAVCQDTQWKQIPVCKKIGESCGPPPSVDYGDTITERKAVHASGTFVEYKCMEYYELQGNKRVRCENGVWEDAPVCIEPCTAGEREMEDNNIQLRWKSDKKLYIRNADFVGFMCKNGHEISDESLLRIQCERGFLKYPKCVRLGSCILSQTEMEKNSIYINKTAVVNNRETVKFQCYEGMVPETAMTATCIDKSIKYPKCVVEKKCDSTPKLVNGKLKTEQSQDVYDSGSSVEYECNENFELQGSINVKCNNGLWSELPKCLKPCRISQEELDRRNIELQSSGDLLKIHTHNTEVNVKCQSGFRHPNQQSLKGECIDGRMTYPRCFTGRICRLNQDTLDGNKLELDPKHHNENYYGEGDIIQFLCKQGYDNDTGLEGTCVAANVTYPKCKKRNACYINKEELDKNKVEVSSSQQYVEYFESGVNIEFTCQAGSTLKKIRNNNLKKKCSKGILTYPVCE